MGDGWETARHTDRPPILKEDPTSGLIDVGGEDWCLLKLGMSGVIQVNPIPYLFVYLLMEMPAMMVESTFLSDCFNIVRFFSYLRWILTSSLVTSQNHVSFKG